MVCALCDSAAVGTILERLTTPTATPPLLAKSMTTDCTASSSLSDEFRSTPHHLRIACLRIAATTAVAICGVSRLACTSRGAQLDEAHRLSGLGLLSSQRLSGQLLSGLDPSSHHLHGLSLRNFCFLALSLLHVRQPLGVASPL